jgi:hypothetical protein
MKFKDFLQLNEWIVYPKDLRDKFVSELENASVLLKSGEIVKYEAVLSKLINQISYNLKMLVKQKENFAYDFGTEYNFSKQLYEKLYELNKNNVQSRLNIIPFAEFAKRYLG